MRVLTFVMLSALAMQVQAAVTDKTSTSVSAADYSADLMQLYRESRLEDPRVLASYADAQSGKEKQREAFGALLPQASIQNGYNRITRSDDTTRDSYDTKSYALTITQHLYNKAAWENYQKFKSLAKQSKYQAEESQVEATVDLAQRYFAALASDDELELVQAERRATQKNLDRVAALYERQMAMITDKLDLQARVDALAAQEVEASNQVQLSRAALSEIVGRPVKERLSRIRDDIEFQAPGQSLESWVDEALAQNPSLKASEKGVDAAEAALRGGKGGHYPTLSLNLAAQESDVGYDNTVNPRTDSYVASVGVQIPLYSGGSTSARVRGLYADQVSAEQRQEAVRRQVVKETTSAYMTADSSVEKIRASRNALKSAQLSRESSEKAFSYGRVNAVDVLNSVQAEYKARRDLLKAQYDFMTNVFILNRWAGKMSEESVESVNVWLSSSQNERASQRNTTQ